eukprot:32516_2
MHRHLLRICMLFQWLTRRQCLNQHTDGIGFNGILFRELNIEGNIELALNERILVHGHALIFDALDVTRLNDFPRISLYYFASIELVDNEGRAAQRFHQGDLLLNEEIVVLALEDFVLFLLYHKDHVTRLNARFLIRLTRKCDLLTVFHAFVDIDLKNFLIAAHLFASARGAPVLRLHRRATALAVGALHLHLLDHTRRNLPDHHFDAITLARLARGVRTRILATTALASCADDVARKGQLHSLTIVQVLVHLDRMHQIFSLFGPLSLRPPPKKAEKMSWGSPLS